MKSDDLPPRQQCRLSGWGWLATTGSAFIALSVCADFPRVGILYLFLVGLGVLVAIPGGAHYQGDVDAFFTSHPEACKTDLPWPDHYDALSRGQAWRYAKRGFGGAAAQGLLMPVMLVIALLAQVAILQGRALDHLYIRDKCRGTP